MKDQAAVDTEVVASPCVSICCLNDDDICIGCFRSGVEISTWGKMDNAAKRAVLKRVAQRMQEAP